MDEVLKLFKLDIGITHTARDEYFNSLLKSCFTELGDKGIRLDLTNSDDMILLSDYSAWQYRNRMKSVPISQNLKLRLRNRKVKGRVASE